MYEYAEHLGYSWQGYQRLSGCPAEKGKTIIFIILITSKKFFRENVASKEF